MALETNSSDMGYSEPFCEEFSRDTLERSKEVIFIVDSELRITYCNPAWDDFALANGGKEVLAARVLATDLMSVIPEPLRDFYGQVVHRCRQNHLGFDLDYECSSGEMYRLLHMSILPLKRARKMAFVNSTRVEHVHGPERPALRPADVYFSTQGLITMCCHCRRTRRQDRQDVWDWVPVFVKSRAWQVSHGICPVCKGYFYSKYFTANGSPGPI